MTFLLDTNVLLRLEDVTDAQHRDAKADIGRLDVDGRECVIVPQVLYEFWVVATRPQEANGLGMTVAKAEAAIIDWTTVFRAVSFDQGLHSSRDPKRHPARVRFGISCGVTATGELLTARAAIDAAASVS